MALCHVTKRCCLSWLTNSAIVYEPKCGGKGELLYTGAQINFGSDSIFNLCSVYRSMYNVHVYRAWLGLGGSGGPTDHQLDTLNVWIFRYRNLSIEMGHKIDTSMQSTSVSNSFNKALPSFLLLDCLHSLQVLWLIYPDINVFISLSERIYNFYTKILTELYVCSLIITGLFRQHTTFRSELRRNFLNIFV